MYDKYGMEGIKQNLSSDDGNGFPFFGGRSQRPRRTQDIVHDYPIKLEDLYKGKTAKFRVTHKIVCPTCKGRGGSEGCEKSCPDCSGRGVRVRVIRRGNMIQQMQSACSTCNGKGTIIDPTKQCKACKGSKVIPETRVIEVCIDRGMKEGDRVILPSAADEAPGMEAGDIVYVIHEQPHNVFKRKGPDLLLEVHISLAEALCGFTRNITQLDGRVLRVTVPGGIVTEPNAVKIVRNEGMPIRGSLTDHGSLFIHFNVDFPANMSPSDVEEIKKVLKYPAQPQRVEGGEDVQMTPCTLDRYGSSVYVPEQHDVGARRWSEV